MSLTRWIKTFAGLAIGGLWLFWGTMAPAATVRSITNLPAVQPQEGPTHKVERVTYLIRSYDGRTLHLTNGKKYDLQSVSVSDFGGKGKGSKSAELTFVDSKLKDVVIRKVR